MLSQRNLSKLIRDLQRRKARERRNLVVLEGRRLVEDALAAEARAVGIVAAEDAGGLGAILDRAGRRGVQVERVTARELAELAETDHPSGVIAVVEWEPPRIAELPEPPLGATILVLDAIQDPGNVGTMLRTSLALGVWAAIALDGTADVRSGKVLRAAMGAHFRLGVAEGSLAECAAFLRRHDARIMVSDAAASNPPARGPGERVALVVGNEGQGVRDDWNEVGGTTPVGIPMAGGAESLNAAIAAAIMLYELTRER